MGIDLRVSFFTQGCRLNLSESAAMRNSFEEKGFSVVDFSELADVVVINTCTVTENGDADARRLVNKVMRTNPASRIAMVGCLAQIQKERLLDLPGVTWVLGNADKMRVAELVAEGKELVLAPKIGREAFTISTSSVDRGHKRANLKIQDGCDFYCSFCVIPFARGPARSRVFTDIFSEAQVLADSGHREVVLTGINLGTYENDGKGFLDVLHGLQDVRGLSRVRISSIEPTTVDLGVIEMMADPKSSVCEYLHLPIQAGSDLVLETMRRKYSIAEFSDFALQADEMVENLCLGTDVIVGFPGESDASFEETYALLERLPFAYFHVFSYSERKGTLSAKRGEKVPGHVISERSRRLRKLSDLKREVYYGRFLGETDLVLFEQMKKGRWIGMTSRYVKVGVEFDGDLGNQILPVRLDRIENGVVLGSIVGDTETSSG